MKNNQTQNQQDLIIVGGGIIGLFTAYYASSFIKNITIFEKATIGNKEASSFSFTRSIRADYLDVFYASLAYEAQRLWLELQEKSEEQFFITCGCLNIAKQSITPRLTETYAQKSFEILQKINLQPQAFTKKSLRKRFPQFTVDMGRLDTTGGFLSVSPITKLLLQELKKKNVTIRENIRVKTIEETDENVRVATDQGTFLARKLVVSSGIWVNDVLKLIKDNTITFPIRPYKPKERKYFFPPQEKIARFLPKNFPVFAYLDVGIYGHPIFDKKKGAIKISYYYPPDLGLQANTKINSVTEFVKQCLPELKDMRSEDITDADLCAYDLVEDDNFIIGRLPNYKRITVGAGWRGTGYKFSPIIGKILTQLALQEGTIYDISRFSPKRFVTDSSGEVISEKE